jgi:hypothetical protein
VCIFCISAATKLENSVDVELFKACLSGPTPRIGPLHGSQIDLALMEYDDARVLIEAIATEAKDEELDDSF